eukprot:Lithocolla_globosa_v1_NODE_4961_length_1328_cov_16.739984.p1 type:complete len:114 gc:universal NODE_4961_length_1328_cov_16.739984:635-976(+)
MKRPNSSMSIKIMISIRQVTLATSTGTSGVIRSRGKTLFPIPLLRQSMQTYDTCFSVTKCVIEEDNFIFVGFREKQNADEFKILAVANSCNENHVVCPHRNLEKVYTLSLTWG